jgi:antibiotic biosynthesis monooxygenase (ABM) superfamily enzyme
VKLDPLDRLAYWVYLESVDHLDLLERKETLVNQDREVNQEKLVKMVNRDHLDHQVLQAQHR